MQSLFDVAQIADQVNERLFDRSIHNRTRDLKAEIVDRAGDIMGDTDRFMEVVLESSFVDYEQISNTLRAMVTAYALGNEQSMIAFAKSICLDVKCGIDDRAEWELTK